MLPLAPPSQLLLQAGAAAIAVGGLQRFRVEQLGWELSMSPGLGGYRSRRRAAHRLAQVQDGHLDVSATFHSAPRLGALVPNLAAA